MRRAKDNSWQARYRTLAGVHFNDGSQLLRRWYISTHFVPWILCDNRHHSALGRAAGALVVSGEGSGWGASSIGGGLPTSPFG